MTGVAISYVSADGIRWAWRQVGRYTQQQLPLAARHILQAIAVHADAKGFARPSVDRLSGLTQLPDRSIRRALRQLEALKIIRASISRGRFSNHYQLQQWAELAGIVATLSPQAAVVTPTRATATEADDPELPGLGPVAESRSNDEMHDLTANPDSESGHPGLRVRSPRTQSPVTPDSESGKDYNEETIELNIPTDQGEKGAAADAPPCAPDVVVAFRPAGGQPGEASAGPASVDPGRVGPEVAPVSAGPDPVGPERAAKKPAVKKAAGTDKPAAVPTPGALLEAYNAMVRNTPLVQMGRLDTAAAVQLTKAIRHPALRCDIELWKKYVYWASSDPFLRGERSERGGYGASLMQLTKDTVIDRFAKAFEPKPKYVFRTAPPPDVPVSPHASDPNMRWVPATQSFERVMTLDPKLVDACCISGPNDPKLAGRAAAVGLTPPVYDAPSETASKRRTAWTSLSEDDDHDEPRPKRGATRRR